MKSTYIRLASAAIIATGALSSPVAHASGRTVDVTGAWQQDGAVCTVDSVDASNVAHLTCTGLATAEGDWTGLFKEQVVANLDLNTGNSWGTSTQEFTGRASDGGTGTITMNEDFTIASNCALHGIAKITGGTGDFAGSSGRYEAFGCSFAVGLGGYTARWIRP